MSGLPDCAHCLYPVVLFMLILVSVLVLIGDRVNSQKTLNIWSFYYPWIYALSFVGPSSMMRIEVYSFLLQMA